MTPAQTMKPILKYPGSKHTLAGEIALRIPRTRTYLEPFAVSLCGGRLQFDASESDGAP